MTAPRDYGLNGTQLPLPIEGAELLHCPRCGRYVDPDGAGSRVHPSGQRVHSRFDTVCTVLSRPEHAPTAQSARERAAARWTASQGAWEPEPVEADPTPPHGIARPGLSYGILDVGDGVYISTGLVGRDVADAIAEATGGRLYR